MGNFKGSSKFLRRSIWNDARAREMPWFSFMYVCITLFFTVFVFCWTPYWTFNLLAVYDRVPQSQSNIAISVFIQSLYPLNSAANPLIFFLFNSALYKRLCAKRSPTAPPTTSVSHLWRHFLIPRLSSVVEVQNTLTGCIRVTWLIGWWCFTYIPVISFNLCCILTEKYILFL